MVRSAAGRFVGIQVDPFERDDAVILGKAEVARDAVGIKPGGVDDAAGLEIPRPAGQTPVGASQVSGILVNDNALLERVLFHRAEDLGGVGSGGGGREKGALEGPHARFDGFGLRGGQGFQFDPIGLAAALQFVKLRQVRGVPGHHQLAAAVNREVPALAVFVKDAVALAREPRLQAVGAIVEAGVEHAAVAAAGVEAAVRFLFQEHDARIGESALEFAGDAQSDNAAANNQKIRGVHCRVCQTLHGAWPPFQRLASNCCSR